MRDGFLERLYRHRVADARLAPLLSDLDGVRRYACAAPRLHLFSHAPLFRTLSMTELLA